MDRLRDLRGDDTRERDLANVLGFEHSRAVRWKEGEMYVDRAEYLVRLSEVLEVDTMLVVQLAAGNLSLEQAQRQLSRQSRPAPDEGRKRKSTPVGGVASGVVERFDSVADAQQFATDAERLAGARGTVLLVSASGEGRGDLSKVLDRHAALAGLVATNLAMGLTLAERYRPEVLFLDLGVASVHAFDSIRVCSALVARSGRRCRVIVGTSSVTEAIEKSAAMSGAAGVGLFPFPPSVFAGELSRLEERGGARRATRA